MIDCKFAIACTRIILPVQVFPFAHATMKHWNKDKEKRWTTRWSKIWKGNFVKLWQGYIRNYTWRNRTSLRELPLSISAYLYIHYISISDRLSSTGNQVHAFYTTVVLSSQAWSIINIIFLPHIMPRRKHIWGIFERFTNYTALRQSDMAYPKVKVNHYPKWNQQLFWTSR